MPDLHAGLASTDASLRSASYGTARKVGGQHINGEAPVHRNGEPARLRWREGSVRLSAMKTLGVIANCDKPQAPAVLTALGHGAAAHGLELVAEGATARLLGEGCHACEADRLFERAEAVLVLGGDGTMLSAVRALGGRSLPLMGVNIGSLGFMTSVAEENLDSALRCLKAESFTVSERSLLACALMRGGRAAATYHALNDVVIANGSSSRVAVLDVRINDAPVTSYVCDGLIVSTPTGSTGHSLSAGGPIVMPSAPVFVLSLICPHTLSSRPLVIPDTARLAIEGQAGGGSPVLSVDGQVGQPLVLGDTVVVTRGDYRVRFLHLPDYSYFGVLRQKLRWSGSSVAAT